jgi:prolyl-tRNA synthetase
MGGSASEEFLAIAENGEDTYVGRGAIRANVEPSVPVPDRSLRRRPAAHAEDTPDTRPSRPGRHSTPLPSRRPAWTAGTPEERGVQLLPTAARALAVGARRPRRRQKRLRRRYPPPRSSRSPRRLRGAPALVKGYIGPGLGEAGQRGDPLPRSTPGRRPAPSGSPAPTSRVVTCSTSSRGATSTPTA